MTLSRVLKHQRLNRSIAELFNSYFVSVSTSPSEVHSLSEPFTPSHPTLNELEIPVEMILTTLKQLDINKATDGIPVCLLKETADQIAPSLSMLYYKPLLLGIFPEDSTLEYSTHFQERKKRLCEELSPYLPSSCHLQSSRALCSGGFTELYIALHQPRTTWLFSW